MSSTSVEYLFELNPALQSVMFKFSFSSPSCLIVSFPRHFGSSLFALNRLSTIPCTDFKQVPFSSQLRFIV